MSRKIELTAEQIEKLAQNQLASRWQKNDHDRIYINGLLEWSGHDWNNHKSGTVASATHNGELISNSEFNRRNWWAQNSKLFYNIKTSEFVAQLDNGNYAGLMDEVIDAVISSVTAETAA